MFTNTWKNFVKRMYETLWETEIAQAQASYEAQINDLKKQLANPSPLVCPEVLGKITYAEAYTLLKTAYPTADIWLSDDYFDLTSMQLAQSFTQETKVQYEKWVNEAHDCDNFSFALSGYWSDSLKSFAFGFAWSEVHAFNIMIDKDKQIWVCEPQTNAWCKIEKVNENYKNIKLVVM